ncbi:MAG TPA: potassium channel family protein [Thermoanaerobaculia bacterium]
MLALLIVAIFIAMPLEVMGYVSPLLVTVVITFLMLSGVVTISGSRTVAVVAAAVALASLGLRWAYFVSPSNAVGCWGDGLGIVALLLVVAFLLRHVFREGPITSDRIQGAIAVYLLVGLVFCLAYQLVDSVAPGSFHFSEPPLPERAAINHRLMYFSFVTLTTVGYGDITPVHTVARVLAIGEALVGQLYPAILIGRLVSLQISARNRG